jgi:hypothetical protein
MVDSVQASKRNRTLSLHFGQQITQTDRQTVEIKGKEKLTNSGKGEKYPIVTTNHLLPINRCDDPKALSKLLISTTFPIFNFVK